MSPHSFSTAGVDDQYKINQLEEKAVDRDAIRERMQFYKLEQQHLGKSLKDFPFDTTDLARFVLRVIRGQLPQSLEPEAEEKEDPMSQAHPSVYMSEVLRLKQKVNYLCKLSG